MHAAMDIQELEFKLWEKVLIAFATLLFLGSFHLYTTDYSLSRYIFNVEDSRNLRQVGTVSLNQGVLRRQLIGASEFKGIDAQAPLYNEDTVVTGPSGAATLQLEDGSLIELAANTMVRLRFETNLTLGGISRAASVDVVSGEVTGEAKNSKITVRSSGKVISIPRATRQVVSRPQMRPTPFTALVPVAVIPVPVVTPQPSVIAVPSPIPIATLPIFKSVELLSPKRNQRLTVDKGSQVAEKKITLTWRVSPPDRRVLVTLWKMGPSVNGVATRTEVFYDIVEDLKGVGSVSWVLKSPGDYEWGLRGPQGEQIGNRLATRSAFSLAAGYEGLTILTPLVGGEPFLSNRLHDGRELKNFDITLRWKPYPDAKTYRIKIKTQPNDERVVLEKMVDTTQYSFNKDKVYSGQVYYQVLAPQPNGFIAESMLTPFVFTFLAPSLTVPPHHSVFTQEQLASEGNSILFTWQKTNFTDFYEIEIARDPDFNQIIQKMKLSQNFYVFKDPAPSKYFWRVKSSAKRVLSPPSVSFDLTVKR